jgi:hypothetical protein
MEVELGICWARDQRPNQLDYVPDVENGKALSLKKLLSARDLE